MNNIIKENRIDELRSMGFESISVTDTLSCASMSLHIHKEKWILSRLRQLHYELVDKFTCGNTLTIYFK